MQIALEQPDVDVLKALASLSGDERWERVQAWMKRSLDEIERLDTLDDGDPGPARGAKRTLRLILEEARKAPERVATARRR